METTELKRVELGDTGLEITRVGFGAWAIGGGGWEFGWGPQEDEQSIAAIHRALELGVNWIDTAAAYGFGHSEEVVGRALEGLRRAAVRVHEGSLLEGPDRRVVHSLKRDSILREAHASLERLRSRRDRPLPDPLADPERGHRGGLGALRRAQGAGAGPPYRRLELRRRAAAADPADRAGRDAPAAVLADRARRRARDPPVLRARGDRRDRVLADGLRAAHREDDPRADRRACPTTTGASTTRGSTSRSCRATSSSSSAWRRSPGGTTPRRARSRSRGRLRNPAVDGAIVGFRSPEPGRPADRRRPTSSSPTRTSPTIEGGQ